MSERPSLLDRFRRGDVRALSRLLSVVENRHAEAGRVLAELAGAGHHAYRIGLTGAPGAGKSTLGNRLVAAMMARELSVAVVAVDPTSPFSGGALLGDRVRFEAPPPAPGRLPAFIRSAASRGRSGGLAASTADMALVLDAFGYERLLIETVGVGQTEVDIARACDTTVVVAVPESGDDVQANKAGLLEVADILVINKADRPGARQAQRRFREALAHQARRAGAGWEPPVVLTTASTGQGVEALAEAIEAHRDHRLSQHPPEALRRQRLERELALRLREALLEGLDAALAAGRLPGGTPLAPVVEAMARGETHPVEAARQVAERLLDGPGDGDEPPAGRRGRAAR